MKGMALRTAIFSVMLAGCLLIGAAPASPPEDIRNHPACPVCGMDRQQYAHSRMLIDYREGPVGTCSIHCVGVDIAVNRHKTVRGIFAADYAGKQLVPATTAFWVIGGDRSGVMTGRAKWAFGNRADADAFIRDHGGTLAVFDHAIKATFEDMYLDIKSVRKRSQERKMRSTR
jgi:nitrous oxide reductase accessory protein NosL